MSKFTKKSSLTVGKDKTAEAKAPKADKADKADKATKALKGAEKIINKKLAKVDKAPKTPKAKAEPKGDDLRKITVVAKENPKREGTAAYEMFNLYKKSKTVKDFLANGGTSSCLRHDAAKDFIKIA